jgi:hypothetical protein
MATLAPHRAECRARRHQVGGSTRHNRKHNRFFVGFTFVGHGMAQAIYHRHHGTIAATCHDVCGTLRGGFFASWLPVISAWSRGFRIRRRATATLFLCPREIFARRTRLRVQNDNHFLFIEYSLGQVKRRD